MRSHIVFAGKVWTIKSRSDPVIHVAFNDSVSWLIGRSGDVVIPRSKKVEKIEKTINRFGSVALFFWSLIPIPYDIIGFIAGYLEFPYRNFITPHFWVSL